MSAVLSAFASVPPLLIAVTIGLGYCYVAAGRWQWSMLPDAGLLALYLWRPSVGMLAFVLLLLSVRHVPAFAREVVVMFRLDEYEGWTLRAILFALPSLRAYATESVPTCVDLPPPVTGATTLLPTLPTRPLAAAEWLHAVNSDPTAPHLGIIGPTQLGKTTFALALLSRRAGEVVITTTKNDPWAGAVVQRPRIDLVAGAVDWAPIVRAIRLVHFEMLRRNAENDCAAPLLTLVLDEYTTTLANIGPAARAQMLEIWSMGASCGVRSVVIAQEVNATAWGIVGRRDILGNLVFAQVTPDRRWALGRIDPNGRLLDPQPLDTTPLLTLAAQAVLAGQEWSGVGVAVGAGENTAPQTHTHAHTPPTNDAEQRITTYVGWRKAGLTRDQARAIRQGDGAGLDDREWAEAGKRLTN